MVNAVELSDLLEDTVGKVRDSHFFVDHLFLILKLSWFFLAETWQCSWWELAKKACGAFGTIFIMSIWKIKLFGTFWHKLVIFCNIPISCVIDFYFIELHASNMLKFINIFVIFHLLYNFLCCSVTLRLSLDHLDIRKVLVRRFSDHGLHILFINFFVVAEFCNSRQNDVNELNIQAGRQKST